MLPAAFRVIWTLAFAPEAGPPDAGVPDAGIADAAGPDAAGPDAENTDLSPIPPTGCACQGGDGDPAGLALGGIALLHLCRRRRP